MEKMNREVKAFALERMFANIRNSSFVYRKFFEKLDKGPYVGEEDYDEIEVADVAVGGYVGISYKQFIHNTIESNTDHTHLDDFMFIWNAISPKSINQLYDAGWEPVVVFVDSHIMNNYVLKLIVRNCKTSEDIFKEIPCVTNDKDLDKRELSLFENEIFHFVNQPENMNN